MTTIFYTEIEKLICGYFFKSVMMDNECYSDFTINSEYIMKMNYV